MRHLTRTRRRKIVTTAVAVFLLAVASAAAYYLVFGDGAGEGSATLGSGTPEPLTLTATFASGLKPGGEEPVTYKAENKTKALGEVATLTATVSTSTGGCNPEWFRAEGKDGFGNGGGPLTTPVMIAKGETKTISTEDILVFKEESSVNQSACEGATVTLHLASTP
jgi:hypothetical protein